MWRRYVDWFLKVEIHSPSACRLRWHFKFKVTYTYDRLQTFRSLHRYLTLQPFQYIIDLNVLPALKFSQLHILAVPLIRRYNRVWQKNLPLCSNSVWCPVLSQTRPSILPELKNRVEISKNLNWPEHHLVPSCLSKISSNPCHGLQQQRQPTTLKIHPRNARPTSPQQGPLHRQSLPRLHLWRRSRRRRRRVIFILT